MTIKESESSSMSSSSGSEETSDATAGASSGYCEQLQVKVACDTVYLTQIVPLFRRQKGTCNYRPVSMPSYEFSKLCWLYRNPKGLPSLVRPFLLGLDKKTRDARVPYLAIAAELIELDRKQERELRRHKRLLRVERSPDEDQDARAPHARIPLLVPGDERDALIARASKRMNARLAAQPQFATAGPPAMMRPVGPGQKIPFDGFRHLVSRLPARQPDEAKPTIGFELVYRQDWCSQGYRRGRLVRSIPLTADGRVEISIKSWSIRKDRREHNESVENDISTEIVGDEKWSHATTKQVSAELNQTIDANLKAKGDVPIQGVTVGAEGGVGSSTSGTLSSSITDTEERIHQATVKSSDTLRKKTSSAIETAEESGFETTIKETIVNPNKCNSLTYHFYEVTELYDVTTKIAEVHPVVLVPLTLPEVTPDWLLCHECLLRRHLPCETYYAGFVAAKTVLARGLLGEFLGDLGSPEVQQAADATLQAVEAVIDTYLTLSNATISLAASDTGDGNVLEQAWSDFETAVGEFGAGLEDLVTGAGEAVGDFVEDVVENAEEIAEAAGGFFTSVGESLFGQARMAGARPLARSLSFTPGGVGSHIWWQVAKISAPELETSLSGLAAAHEQIAAMPAGAARVNALGGALKTFFATLGDVDAVFSKIDTGLAVVAAALAASTFGGAAIVITFVGATGIIAAPITLALLGGAAVLALGEFAVAIIGMLVGDSSLDIVPDDAGLKAAIGALYGSTQQLGQAADLPQPPKSDDPGMFAAYQQELLEAKQRRRELAEAQVELARLTCHIKENISYYGQVYWLSLPAADLERQLQAVFALPPHRIEPRIVGFSGSRAAFRVRSPAWLGITGIDVARTIRELREDRLLNEARQRTDIAMPSRGMVVEPELGHCDGCDEFVHFHRAQDMELKLAEVAQARLETQRLQERLNRGLLGDPTPFEGAASVKVQTAAPTDVATPAPGGSGG
jgi:hypothetical protein